MYSKEFGSIGPIDYVVLLFRGNKVSGRIVQKISDLEQSGVIRVIDLVFVIKDADQTLRTMDVRDFGDKAVEAFAKFSHGIRGWLSSDDVETIGTMLAEDGSAAVMLIENAWVQKLKQEVSCADARMISKGRIPHLVLPDA